MWAVAAMARVVRGVERGGEGMDGAGKLNAAYAGLVSRLGGIVAIGAPTVRARRWCRNFWTCAGVGEKPVAAGLG